MNERVFFHQLDAKNRMRLPSRLRERFTDGYAVMRWSGEGLRVVPIAEYHELLEKFKKVSVYNASEQRTIDKILYYSWEAVEDAQGRILIPDYIRNKFNFVKNLVIVDSFSGVRIWAEEEWNKYIGDDEGFDESLERIGELLGE